MKRNENILKYAENQVIKSKMYFTKTGWFKLAKVVFYLVGIYYVLVSLTMLLGTTVMMSGYAAQSNATEVALYNELRVQMWSMVIAILATVATFVLLRFKSAVPLSVLGLVNCAISFFAFYGASVKNDIANGGQTLFWATFGVSSIAFAVLGLAIAALILFERSKVYAVYEKIVEDIYKKHSVNSTDILTPEECEKLLDEYNGQELFRSDIPLKKSLKRRKQKQEDAE